MNDAAFQSIKDDLAKKHERFIAMLIVLREHGCSADVAATLARDLIGDGTDPRIAERHAAAARVLQGRYDVDGDESAGAMVEKIAKQAADHVRAGL